MMTVRCYLAPSAIEGLGVFAAEPIARGGIAWRFNPQFDQVFSYETLADQPEHVREFLERYGYAHHEDPSLWVLDADEGRFMNHALAPNLDFSSPTVGVATRDIAAGEELTCDYACFTVGEVVMQPPRHLVGPSVVAANGSARPLNAKAARAHR